MARTEALRLSDPLGIIPGNPRVELEAELPFKNGIDIRNVSYTHEHVDRPVFFQNPFSFG
ncbi:hypothetical protein D3C81_2224950 [compost metagenome]